MSRIQATQYNTFNLVHSFERFIHSFQLYFWAKMELHIILPQRLLHIRLTLPVGDSSIAS